MSDVDSRHPDYEKAKDNWVVMDDAAEGDLAVKGKDEAYLPMPDGFKKQDDSGAAYYKAYKTRSQFPEITAPSARGMVGMVHRVPAVINLPPALEGLRVRATPDGVSLNDLHERITYEVLMKGRYGLLADMPTDEQAQFLGDFSDMPYIAGYKADSIINWSNQGDFFVLDESGLKREEGGYEWKDHKQFRELALENGIYVVKVYEGDNMDQNSTLEPQKALGAKLEEIPFTVVGSTDITPGVDEIPLLPVARSAIAVYQLYADYRHQLFWSGQATLFIINAPDELPKLVGSGVIIGLPEDADAKYVSPDGTTLEAHRKAIEDEYDKAIAAGAKMLATDKRAAESGDAIKRRMISQTASLVTVALNSSKGLEKALKHCAMFVGANPDDVTVDPNLSFIETGLSPEALKALVEAWMSGAISKTTLYENLQRGEIASHDRSFEEEQELIEQDMPDVDLSDEDEEIGRVTKDKPDEPEDDDPDADE